MKTAAQIQQAMLKTQDPRELTSLVNEALELVKFYASKLEFTEIREKRLRDQVARQTQMITNLENTLWKK